MRKHVALERKPPGTYNDCGNNAVRGIINMITSIPSGIIMLSH